LEGVLENYYYLSIEEEKEKGEVEEDGVDNFLLQDLDEFVLNGDEWLQSKVLLYDDF
jgi:hypothetical protein